MHIPPWVDSHSLCCQYRSAPHEGEVDIKTVEVLGHVSYPINLLHVTIIYAVTSKWVRSADLRQVLWARRQCACVTACARPHSRRLLRQDSMSGRKTLLARPEPESTLRQMRSALPSAPVRQQAGVRHRWRHLPELLSPAGGRMSQGQGHPRRLQGTLQT